MPQTRRTLLLIWAITTLVVLAGALLLYRSFTEVPLLAGRTEPVSIYEDPTLLFEDPGILGSAIEVQVTERIQVCMEAQGFTYRGPARVDELDALLGPDAGYGIAVGPEPPGNVLGSGGPRANERTAYEAALYGADLDAGTAGGCAAEGRLELDAALATIESMPYSLDQLQADAWAHPANTAALVEWRACMSSRGYDAQSPVDVLEDLTSRLATVTGAEARGLADEERAIAAADRECRRGTIDAAVGEIAADLAPRFVEQNRVQLEALIPPPENRFGGGGDEDLGSGDVQVTLRWDSGVDFDLSISDPEGFVIDFENRNSPSGGELDRDANYPCSTASDEPVENVYWPVGQAPEGSYTVTVTYRTSCGDEGPQQYSILVLVGARPYLTEVQTIEAGETRSYDFGYPG